VQLVLDEAGPAHLGIHEVGGRQHSALE
jgi:hypothetical protein